MSGRSPYHVDSEVERTQMGQAWSRQDETRLFKKAIGDAIARAEEELMGAAAKSSDPKVTKAWANWATLMGVFESLQRTERGNGN